jgi:hypothetical protein
MQGAHLFEVFCRIMRDWFERSSDSKRLTPGQKYNPKGSACRADRIVFQKNIEISLRNQAVVGLPLSEGELAVIRACPA